MTPGAGVHSDDLLATLRQLLRPAAGGIYTVSTGKAEQLALQRRLYGAADEAGVQARWEEALARATTPGSGVVVAVLGVPSDVGAGYVRGANLGPQAVREALSRRRPGLLQDPRVVDVGDVFVVPQLLEDEMLSPEQLARTRLARHGDAASPLPVSPLTCAAWVVALLRRAAPALRILTLGGDHSVTWPVFAELVRDDPASCGVLHFDAHTDLLPERLGVLHCFATWAYHANDLIGRGGRMVQVGIRASGRDRAHWEATLGVRQLWMDEVRARPIEEVAGRIADHLEARGVRRLYISNDIDGTDAAFAGSTGTPEGGGLHPDEVVALVRLVGARFAPLGADLVEVAPPVGRAEGEPGRTLDTAARYVSEEIDVLLGPPAI